MEEETQTKARDNTSPASLWENCPVFHLLSCVLSSFSCVLSPLRCLSARLHSQTFRSRWRAAPIKAPFGPRKSRPRTIHPQMVCSQARDRARHLCRYVSTCRISAGRTLPPCHSGTISSPAGHVRQQPYARVSPPPSPNARFYPRAVVVSGDASAGHACNFGDRLFFFSVGDV